MNKIRRSIQEIAQSINKPCFFMRQSGRFIPEFRDIFSNNTFNNMLADTDTVIKLTLLPTQHFQTDFLIHFSDILYPFITAGLSFDYKNGPQPLFSTEDINSHFHNSPECFPELQKIVSGIRQQSNKPLFGFIGGPFTLLHFLTKKGTKSDLNDVKILLHSNYDLFSDLMAVIMSRLKKCIDEIAKSQMDALYLFDSFLYDLQPDLIEKHALPLLIELKDYATDAGLDMIFYGGRLTALVPLLPKFNPQGVHLDSHTTFEEVFTSGYQGTLVGNAAEELLYMGYEEKKQYFNNLTNFNIFNNFNNFNNPVSATGDINIEKPVKPQAHIFSLGGGIPPNTDPSSLSEIITLWKESA